MKNEKPLVRPDPPGPLAARPSFMDPLDRRGTEDLRKEDLQLPRLALGQGLSPEVVPGDPRYIEALKIGDIFNTLTKQNYGPGPLTFAVVRRDPPRGIEFFPRKQGGGIKDFSVPLYDPRMRFGPNGESPLATKFYDFVAVLLPQREVVALSFKSTGLKVARTLNTLIKLREAPVFACLYQIASVMVTNSKGTYAMFSVDNAGWVTDEQTYRFLEHLYDAVADRPLVIEREGAAEETGGEDVPF